ncbi:MAG: hypothetical protein U5L96_11385 [Owenweeksia sp.]|nr:hypothetical protein [Owenweeksia sp.]
MGADDTIFRFSRLKNIHIEYIPWQPVCMEESLGQHTLQKLARGIDQSQPYALGGVSLGGICAQEMTRFLKPEKLLLISTIKSREELPPLLRMAASSRLQKIIPDRVHKWAAMAAAVR